MVFGSQNAYEKATQVKIVALDTGARFLSAIIRLPGTLLIRLGLLSSLTATVLVLLAMQGSASVAWKFALGTSIMSLVVLGLFTWRRQDLLKRLAKSGPAQVVSLSGAQLIFPESPASPTDQLNSFARSEAEAVAAARAEFADRRARFLPGIEAGQRALRQLAGGVYEGDWLNHDLRPTLILFILGFLSMPVMFFISILALIGLLVGA